jgi:hypothetical protein
VAYSLLQSSGFFPLITIQNVAPGREFDEWRGRNLRTGAQNFPLPDRPISCQYMQSGKRFDIKTKSKLKAQMENQPVSANFFQASFGVKLER